MIRLSFPLNLAIETDSAAQRHLLSYKRSTRPEIIRRWLLLASLSPDSQCHSKLFERYPYTGTTDRTMVEVRCTRALPEQDPVLKVMLKAKTFTTLEKERYLRALFLLGRAIHLGATNHRPALPVPFESPAVLPTAPSNNSAGIAAIAIPEQKKVTPNLSNFKNLMGANHS